MRFLKRGFITIALKCSKLVCFSSDEPFQNTSTKYQLLFQFPRKQHKVHHGWLPLTNRISEFRLTPSSVAASSHRKGNLADNNVISWNWNNNSWFAFLWRDIRLYFSSVLLEVYILGLVIARDLWKHSYLNAYGFEDIIHWKQKISSFLLKYQKATFYEYI